MSRCVEIGIKQPWILRQRYHDRMLAFSHALGGQVAILWHLWLSRYFPRLVTVLLLFTECLDPWRPNPHRCEFLEDTIGLSQRTTTEASSRQRGQNRMWMNAMASYNLICALQRHLRRKAHCVSLVCY